MRRIYTGNSNPSPKPAVSLNNWHLSSRIFFPLKGRMHPVRYKTVSLGTKVFSMWPPFRRRSEADCTGYLAAPHYCSSPISSCRALSSSRFASLFHECDSDSLGDGPGSIDALRRSLEFMPTYAPDLLSLETAEYRWVIEQTGRSSSGSS